MFAVLNLASECKFPSPVSNYIVDIISTVWLPSALLLPPHCHECTYDGSAHTRNISCLFCHDVISTKLRFCTVGTYANISVNFYVYYALPSCYACYIHYKIYHRQSPMCWNHTKAISTGIHGFPLMYVWMISYRVAWRTLQTAREHGLHHPLRGNIHRSP